MNYTYILECSNGTYYTGWTNDLEKRVRTHNEGKGGKYTRSHRPVRLAYYETFETKEEAMSREFAIKRLTRKEKECLIKSGREDEKAAQGQIQTEEKQNERSRQLSVKRKDMRGLNAAQDGERRISKAWQATEE